MSFNLSRKFGSISFLEGSIIGVIAGALLAGAVLSYTTHGHVTAKVTKTEAVSVRDGDNSVKVQKRVYTDNGVFTCDDSMAYLHFNSADVYGSLQPGYTYDFEKIGLGFLSQVLSQISFLRKRLAFPVPPDSAIPSQKVDLSADLAVVYLYGIIR